MDERRLNLVTISDPSYNSFPNFMKDKRRRGDVLELSELEIVETIPFETFTDAKPEIDERNGKHGEINWDEYMVEFEGPYDPMRPFNWPMKRRITTAVILGYCTLCSTFGSSIFSPGARYAAEEFKVSTEVITLSLSLYVLGFALGPLVWGPLSENVGRKIPCVIGIFGLAVFSLGTAVSHDIQTVLLTRFFGGCFASSPLAVVGAAFADLFDSDTRTIAMTIFVAMVFMGPMLAPIVGGFVAKSYLGWRWTMYLCSIMSIFACILVILFFDECYAPAILKMKAIQIRRKTGNWAYHAKLEEKNVEGAKLVNDLILRPMKLLVTEPIILFLTIYTAFIYGLLYLFLTAYGVEFGLVRGWEPGVSSLPYLGLLVGEIIGAGVVLAFEPFYQRKKRENGGKVVPEARLPPMILGAFCFVGGLFWFGWTWKTEYHWIIPTLSGLLTGIGLLTIFLQAINYIVDSFLQNAATALAANTFLRSIFGAAFPLFALQMYVKLGIDWASTILGIIAACCIPVPVVFYFYGAKLRAMSKNAPGGAMKK